MKKLVLLLLLTSTLCADHFLTFIIPCYNCAEWVEESVDSIYKQAINCPFEIICTDDGSIDSTYPLLLALQEKYPEMVVLRHEKNRGGGAARNSCIAASRGDIIFCLDSDNVLVENSVQILIDRMDETAVDVVCFGAARYFTDNFETRREETYYTKTGYYTFLDFFKEAALPAWSGNYLYTRKSYDAAGGYPEGLAAADTWSFGFLQTLHGAKILYVPDTFYWHRQGIESYYVRETRSGRMDRQIYGFLLRHKELLTEESVKILQKELQKIGNKEEHNNYIHLISHGKIKLKPEVLEKFAP